jgi:hypothetical protein
LIAGECARDVNVTFLEQQALGQGLGDVADHHASDVWRAQMIVRIGLQGDRFVRLPGNEAISAGRGGVRL